MSDDEAIRSPKGMHDILPQEHEFHTYIKKVVRHRVRQAGFRRISTPILESKELFEKSLGLDSDLLSNELYGFNSKKREPLALKLTSTTGIARAYIQHDMHKLPQPLLLYYFEPHFHYDEATKGRSREFWQFGFEVLGESDPALDAQVIHLADRIFRDLGVADVFSLELNTLGSFEARKDYMQVLQDHYTGKERSLCKNCQEALGTNPMRLLSCHEEDCKILAQLAPLIRDYLDEDSVEYYKELVSYLDEIGMKYNESNVLAADFDYYSGTIFRYCDGSKDGNNVIANGGRYDGLIESLGGEPTSAVGISVNVDRLIVNMKRKKIRVPTKDDLHVFVAQLGIEAKKKCLKLIDDLRDEGLKTMGALGKGAINVQLSIAQEFRVPYAVLIGITEVREKTAIIRDMAKGVQETVAMKDVPKRLVKLIGKENLDKYSPGELLYS